jgi:hypothetical protein
VPLDPLVCFENTMSSLFGDGKVALSDLKVMMLGYTLSGRSEVLKSRGDPSLDLMGENSENEGLESPIHYEPITMVLPLATLVGETKGMESEFSKLVKQRCRGFPIGSHKRRCLVLLKKIEQERFRQRDDMGRRSKTSSGIKGTRERELRRQASWLLRSDVTLVGSYCLL